MFKNDQNNYGSLAKFFHWSLALLIIFMLFLGYLMTGMFQFNLHKVIGLVILTLAALRLLWTLCNPRPQLPPNTPWIEILLARVVQCLLYICMLGMPLTGWVMASSFGFPPKFLGMTFYFPGVGINSGVGPVFETIHNTLALLLIGLLVLHVLGALKHAIIDRDGVLSTMLPFRHKK